MLPEASTINTASGMLPAETPKTIAAHPAATAIQALLFMLILREVLAALRQSCCLNPAIKSITPHENHYCTIVQLYYSVSHES